MNRSEEYINQAEEHLLHVYNRFPVVFERGEGVHLYDTEGKEYLDFGSGIGVMALGYGDEEYSNALKEQIDTLTHTSNLFYHPPVAQAAEVMTRLSGWIKYFLQTAVRKQLREPSKRQRNTLIFGMDLPAMKSLPWNILSMEER